MNEVAGTEPGRGGAERKGGGKNNCCKQSEPRGNLGKEKGFLSTLPLPFPFPSPHREDT